jgi:predicted GNAT superfamily acetyltransferase
MNALVIRPIAGVDEMRACEDLQVEVWGYSEREVVPKNELLAAVKSGGSLLGSFEAATLVGFAYGMAGLDERGPFLSSRLLAVRESHRSHGLGEKLKLAQKEDALRLGYARIRWTQDPLQAANARLNFAKLGARARSYVVDYYGATSSPLHGSLPTDRFEVEWAIRSPPEERRTQDLAATLLGTRGSDPERPDPRTFASEATKLLVAIPRSFNAIVARDRDQALTWRLATREAFQLAFASGFEVTGFVSGAYELVKRRNPARGGEPPAVPPAPA